MASVSSTNHVNKPLRVAIIGAGIGGLALAVALSKLVPGESLKVDVYEQAQEIKEIGAGIFFGPRTWPILQQLGVSDAFERLLAKKPDTNRTLIMKMVKSDTGKSIDIFDFYQNGGPNMYHRAAVQKALLDSLPPSVQVHLSHRLLSYDESEAEVVLNFEDCPSLMCDLLVASDGIKSHLRGDFISKRLPDHLECVNPVWSGTFAYRSLIDANKIKETNPDHPSLHNPIAYAGEGKFIVTYPIMQGRFINIVAHVTDYSKEGTLYEGPTTEPVDKDYLHSVFTGWTDDCVDVLKNIQTCSRWVIQYLNPLPTFAVGRVALLGDAAHAMPPTQGSGAGQAIEDAYTLTHLLQKAVQEHIPIHRVTEAYTKARQPLANLVLRRSRDSAKLVSFRTPGYEEFNSEDKETVKRLCDMYASEHQSLYSWLETHPVDKELEKALDML